jgi:subtilisin family serine protease
MTRPPAAPVYGPDAVPTGNTLITFAPETPVKSISGSLKNAGLAQLSKSSDFKSGPDSVMSALDGADAYLIEGINVAVVRGAAIAGAKGMTASQVGALGSTVIEQRPEYFVYALQNLQERYLAWLQESANILALGLPGDLEQATMLRMPGNGVGTMASFADTAALTWGLQAVKAHKSLKSGLGIRVAVLDTGVDMNHPDLAGRIVATQSFVPNETVQDGHSHGTHCIGTACGPLHPVGTTRRYGVAHKARIIAIKVLSNSGSGQESWILQGMQRAVQLKAQVISMSLGRPAVAADPSAAYTNAGQFALNNKSLIVAAAGNSGNAQPVGAPANSPTIFAVGAVDSNLQLANFSCQGHQPNGGEVNIAAPGVATFSSVPGGGYGMKSGTSMATPHVAGCAALWAQAKASNRGMGLWKALEKSALGIGIPPLGAGSGLLQAPVGIVLPVGKAARQKMANGKSRKH